MLDGDAALALCSYHSCPVPSTQLPDSPELMLAPNSSAGFPARVPESTDAIAATVVVVDALVFGVGFSGADCRWCCQSSRLPAGRIIECDGRVSRMWNLDPD